jgi:hypothetical protein
MPNKLTTQEKRLIRETKRIETAEKKIHREEKRILKAEGKILKTIKKNPIKAVSRGGITRREAHFVRQTAIRRLTHHKLVWGILFTAVVVLIWRSIWTLLDTAPSPLSNPILGLIVGIIILWVLKKNTKLH